jgi:hypothetical protein
MTRADSERIRARLVELTEELTQLVAELEGHEREASRPRLTLIQGGRAS